MDPDIRMALIDRALQRLLVRGEYGDDIVVGVTGHPDVYVRFQLDDGAVSAELASPSPLTSSPLGPFAAGFLELYEFALTEDREHYRRDHLSPEPWTLAVMAERLLGVYELGDAFEVEIRGEPTRGGEVTRPPDPWYTPRLDEAWRRDQDRRERRRKRRQRDDARWR